MKGTKTKTTIQVGDLIRVKTGQSVISYAGETGNTDPDTAYFPDILGEVTKISGSSYIFKDLGGRTRNTVSTGSIDFAANPDFEYSPVKDPKTETTFEKYLNLGFGIFDRIFSRTSTTSNNNGSGGGTDGGTDDGKDPKDPKDPKDEEKTFFQKYGVYGIVLAILGLVAYLIFGNKDKPQPQQYQPPQRPVLPQNQPQNQYQNVRL